MGQLAVLFPGQRSAFAHEFAVQAEKSITASCETLLAFANTQIMLFKAMDQGAFMAEFDIDSLTGRPYPNAIDSYDKWNAAVAEAGAQGVTLVPWVVPGHRSQAPLHAQLGKRIVIDAEPYRSFWTDSAGDFAGYIADLIEAGCTEIYVSTDPRRSEENALDESVWASTVAGLLPQVYWTDFEQPYTVVLPMLDAMLQLNPVVIPVLPFDGYPDFPAAWDAMLARGMTGLCLWKLGSAGVNSLRAFGALQPGQAAPPSDPCSDLQQQVATLTQLLSAEQTRTADLQGRLTDIETVLSR